MRATVTSLDAPDKARTLDNAFVDKRYLEDQEYRLRWRWRGNGAAMSNSSPAFQGSRMFFRTVGCLWCIGDPQEPWNASPTRRRSSRENLDEVFRIGSCANPDDHRVCFHTRLRGG